MPTTQLVAAVNTANEDTITIKFLKATQGDVTTYEKLLTRNILNGWAQLIKEGEAPKIKTLNTGNTKQQTQ